MLAAGGEGFASEQHPRVEIARWPRRLAGLSRPPSARPTRGCAREPGAGGVDHPSIAGVERLEDRRERGARRRRRPAAASARPRPSARSGGSWASGSPARASVMSCPRFFGLARHSLAFRRRREPRAARVRRRPVAAQRPVGGLSVYLARSQRKGYTTPEDPRRGGLVSTRVAQLVEQRSPKPQVAGSSPAAPAPYLDLSPPYSGGRGPRGRSPPWLDTDARRFRSEWTVAIVAKPQLRKSAAVAERRQAGRGPSGGKTASPKRPGGGQSGGGNGPLSRVAMHVPAPIEGRTRGHAHLGPRHQVRAAQGASGRPARRRCSSPPSSSCISVIVGFFLGMRSMRCSPGCHALDCCNECSTTRARRRRSSRPTTRS